MHAGRLQFARSIPRQINHLCITALMADCIEQKQILDGSTIHKAIAEIDQV